MSGGTAGLVIAAPASGSGKTVLAAGLMRAFRNAGTAVGSLKFGPDFIDPAFHAAATGRPGRNIDGWAMRAGTQAAEIAAAGAAAELIVAEGVMGLFDGADEGGGSTADVAAAHGWPVVLVVDAWGQAASVGALVEGFARHREDVEVAGVIANRLGSARHGTIIERAVMRAGLPCLGLVPRDTALELPSRHLGLVQAGERAGLDAWLDDAAGAIAGAVDMNGLRALARPAVISESNRTPAVPQLGERIAVAHDAAFSFVYAHFLDGWRRAGAEIVSFSPLAGEPPPGDADAVYLPGGYPELHAREIAANKTFLDGLRAAAGRGAAIYGECGGFMVLGESLVDGEGRRHAMAGLLPVETSFQQRKLSLGYRQLDLAAEGPLGTTGARFRGHEFHYSTVRATGDAEPLFTARDSSGRNAMNAGCRVGPVAGSYIHLVDSAA